MTRRTLPLRLRRLLGWSALIVGIAVFLIWALPELGPPPSVNEFSTSDASSDDGLLSLIGGLAVLGAGVVALVVSYRQSSNPKDPDVTDRSTPGAGP